MMMMMLLVVVKKSRKVDGKKMEEGGREARNIGREGGEITWGERV